MSLSRKLKKFLIKNGATDVGYADINDCSPKKDLDRGVVFYIIYQKKLLKICRMHPHKNMLTNS
jgi:hypothetical protein